MTNERRRRIEAVFRDLYPLAPAPFEEYLEKRDPIGYREWIAERDVILAEKGPAIAFDLIAERYADLVGSTTQQRRRGTGTSPYREFDAELATEWEETERVVETAISELKTIETAAALEELLEEFRAWRARSTQ